MRQIAVEELRPEELARAYFDAVELVRFCEEQATRTSRDEGVALYRRAAPWQLLASADARIALRRARERLDAIARRRGEP